MQENEQYNPDRCHAFQCDLTCDELTNEIPADSIDAVSMIFVLSAIHPDKMEKALSNIHKVFLIRYNSCINICVQFHIQFMADMPVYPQNVNK